MGSTNFDHGLGVCDLKVVKFEQDLVGRSLKQNEDSKFYSNHCQEFNSQLRRHRTEEQKNTSVAFGEQFQIDDSNICSTSSICPAPLSRQFWRAGNYNDMIKSKPPIQNGTTYLRIHPKFLHSNATSHKWAFGAMAELLDNSVDEIQNGATFVIVDKTSNPRDGTPALLFQDNGGGMDPAAMRRCMSFGFSDKKSEGTIGQYGNGFKTSSMRLGADVIVFSRHTRDRKFTQSVGLLSYTFLMQTKQDRIVVPMVDYLFDTQTGSWNTLQHEQQFNTNLSILLRWSPFATEAELLKQCDDISPNGTRIIIYSLWHNDEGKLELDFDVDPEDICISGKIKTKNISQFEANERHLAKRLQHSLRAYLSVLYLRVPDNFSVLLRGRAVEYHSIANDLKFPEFILYKPLNVEGSVITTIGFLKEAPAVNVHGFNVYHKNRLILPFWHVVTYSDSRGRGVVGVLEANFIEPTHNKQDFEKTSVFQKLETRLREMTQEYWDYHCGLIGYQAKKKPRPMTSLSSPNSRQCHGTHQPIILGRYSQGAVVANISTTTRTNQREISTPSTSIPISEPVISKQSFDQNSQGAPLKRKGNDLVVEPERVKRMGVIGSRTIDTIFGGNHVIVPAVQFEKQEAVHIIQENKKLHAQCREYEKGHEELNLKVTRLKAEIREARREYVRLLLESKQLEKVKRENRAVT